MIKGARTPSGTGNESNEIITDDTGLVYTIITISGQLDVIDEKTGSSGVFTLLRNGTAKIRNNYRDKSFIALITIP